jgi:hypothetical protein
LDKDVSKSQEEFASPRNIIHAILQLVFFKIYLQILTVVMMVTLALLILAMLKLDNVFILVLFALIMIFAQSINVLREFVITPQR